MYWHSNKILIMQTFLKIFRLFKNIPNSVFTKRHCCTVYVKFFFIVLDFMFLLTTDLSSGKMWWGAQSCQSYPAEVLITAETTGQGDSSGVQEKQKADVPTGPVLFPGTPILWLLKQVKSVTCILPKSSLMQYLSLSSSLWLCICPAY